MMFSDETNGYFTGPGGSVDTVWKPHPTHNDLNNHRLQNSKLSTWAPPGSRGNNKNDFNYDDASAKAAWNGRVIGGPSGGDKSGNAWGPPTPVDSLGGDMLEQELMHMNINKPPDSFGHGGGGQWGRQEVNQATPWNLDAGANMGGRPPFGGPDGMHPPGRGFMQQQMHFDNESNNHWRNQWDMDSGFGNKPGPGPDFGGPPFGNMPMGNQFGHGRHNFVPPQQQAFNDRMVMHNGPHFSHGHRQPQQPWMNDKFGNNSHHGMHHPMGGPNNGGRFPFGHPGQQLPHGGPPSVMMQPGRPPLMPMQQPPHHNHHPNANVNAGPPSFAMGTFQPQVQNDDSMWQDPNGDLRKWQRDTGTALWGDPAKQNSSEIRRWIQPPNDSDEENLHLPDPLREGKDDIESGWGPPPAPPGQKPQNVAPAPPQPPVQPIGGGWSDGPRGPPPSNFGMAPGSNNFVHAPPAHANNGWSAAPAAPAQVQPAADWTRGGPPPFAAPSLGGFDFQVPAPHNNDNETRKIADKLRLAVSKNLLDMNLLNSSGALTNHHLANNTLSMLNTMLNLVAQLESLEARKDQISMDPSRKLEVDHIQGEIIDVKAELQEFRDKIHNALSAPRGEFVLPAYLQRGSQRKVPVSLADELSNMDNLPNAGVDLPTPLGNEVGQLW